MEHETPIFNLMLKSFQFNLAFSSAITFVYTSFIIFSLLPLYYRNLRLVMSKLHFLLLT